MTGQASAIDPMKKVITADRNIRSIVVSWETVT